jgi:hypothetical protein
MNWPATGIAARLNRTSGSTEGREPHPATLRTSKSTSKDPLARLIPLLIERTKSNPN